MNHTWALLRSATNAETYEEQMSIKSKITGQLFKGLTSFVLQILGRDVNEGMSQSQFIYTHYMNPPAQQSFVFDPVDPNEALNVTSRLTPNNQQRHLM